jgi:hypothetical protein
MPCPDYDAQYNIYWDCDVDNDCLQSDILNAIADAVEQYKDEAGSEYDVTITSACREFNGGSLHDDGLALDFRTMIYRSYILLTFAVAGCSIGADPLRAPEGFRPLSESEYPATWTSIRTQVPTPDRTSGDFDGDGEQDTARLYVSEAESGWVLIAALSSRSDSTIELIRSSERLRNQVVRTIEPGVHRLHRYFGIGAGVPDTSAVVRLEHDAINLSYIESEGYTFVWNAERAEFDRLDMY